MRRSRGSNLHGLVLDGAGAHVCVLGKVLAGTLLLLVAGSPCEQLTWAGPSKGALSLTGRDSALFLAVLALAAAARALGLTFVSTLSQACGQHARRPPGSAGWASSAPPLATTTITMTMATLCKLGVENTNSKAHKVKAQVPHFKSPSLN